MNRIDARTGEKLNLKMKTSKMEVALVDFMGTDDSVVNAARVSFAKEASAYTEEQNAKLIKYLAEHNHWSPFSHCFLSFRIKAPIFVARQLVKHQVGLSWNEVSRRYVDSEPEFFFPEEWRGKPENAKQGSSEEIIKLQYMPVAGDLFSCIDICLLCKHYYEFLLASGVAPEQARMVLPQNTMTEWIWSGSLYAFARVCNLRLDPHAQLETQEVASEINKLAKTLFPISWKYICSH